MFHTLWIWKSSLQHRFSVASWQMNGSGPWALCICFLLFNGGSCWKHRYYDVFSEICSLRSIRSGVRSWRGADQHLSLELEPAVLKALGELLLLIAWQLYIPYQGPAHNSINNLAHITGFVTGACLAPLLTLNWTESQRRRRIIFFAVAALLFLAFLFGQSRTRGAPLHRVSLVTIGTTTCYPQYNSVDVPTYREG